MSKQVTQAVLSKLDIPYKETSSGSFNFNCPFHGDEKRHLYMYMDSGYWRCFKCEEEGNLKAFIAQFLNIPIHEAKTFIGAVIREIGYRGSFLVTETDPKETETEKKFRGLPDFYHPLWCNWNGSLIAKEAYSYWLERGFTKEDAENYKVGFCKIGRYGGRLIIPCHNFSGKEVVYFVARDFTKTSPRRYLNPEIPTSKILFGINRAARHTKRRFIILCEGVMDAMKFGDVAVALLGKKLLPAQRDMLMRGHFAEAVICLDPIQKDPKIRDSIYQIAESLVGHMQVSVMNLQDRDPGSHTKEELKRFFFTRKTVRNLSDLAMGTFYE